MRQLAAVFVVFAIVVICPVVASDAKAQNLTDAIVTKLAQPLIDDHVAKGLSIGYLEGDHYGSVHLGSANKAGEKATNLTLYEIGSITKIFTSLLLADAAVRGEIDLPSAADVTNPAGIRLPSREGRSITWLYLSTHRSGLPRLPTNMSLKNTLDPYRDYDSQKAAAFLKDYTLNRQPGEVQEYSNLGVSVLGYLIAQKVGKTYETLLRERIAEPLKMDDCTISLSASQKKRLATPHRDFDEETSPWSFADLPGAGGIRATMRDMMRFAKAQLVPPDGPLGKAVELAWQEQTKSDTSGPAMGLGWMISGDGQTRWHNGQTGGSHAAIFINRPLRCAVIVLCNTASKEIDQLAIQLIQKAAGIDPKPDPQAKPGKDPNNLAIDDEARRRLVGRYQLTPEFIFTVRDRKGHLMVGITNQATQEVYPDSPTRWSYRGVAATLEFKLPQAGPAQSLVLHQNGLQQTARRIGD